MFASDPSKLSQQDAFVSGRGSAIRSHIHIEGQTQDPDGALKL